MNKYIIKKLNEEYYDFSNIEGINLNIACCGNDERAILNAQGLLNNFKADIIIDYSKFNKDSDISEF
tara:strand:- start:113 stop:313 length:201 start_codon:yes stop_codon:yes gene_type:complete